MSFKKYVLLIFGFIFPIVLVGIYFFWHGGLLSFFDRYFLAWTSTPFYQYVNLNTILVISATGLILTVLAWLKIYSRGRYNNHQTNYMLVMLLFLLAGFIMVFLSRERVPHQLMVFVTPVSFFLSHYFLLIKRRLLAELVFTGFAAITLILNYGVLFQFAVPSGLIEVEKLVVQSTEWDQLVMGKKILIVGEEPDAYLHAYPATPYLNWNLSKSHLEQVKAFNHLSMVYDNLEEDPPEVIIDQKELIPKLFEQMPTIASRYQRQGQAYIRKSSN